MIVNGIGTSELLNIILGGGLAGAILSILTLRAKIRRAGAEAQQAEAQAEAVRMDNAEHATRILMDNIVAPLREELSETRRCLDANKREMARLRKAIDAANSCPRHDDCPVLSGLRDNRDRQPSRATEGSMAADGAAQAPARKKG